MQNKLFVAVMMESGLTVLFLCQAQEDAEHG